MQHEFGLSEHQDFLEQLKVLKLDSNIMVTIDDYSFSSFPHLQKLYISSNVIRTIGQNAFSLLKQLQTIDLGNNQLVILGIIDSFPSETGSIVGYAIFTVTYMHTLNLQNNSLTTIKSYAFAQAKGLRKLLLNTNLISIIDRHAFVGLVELQHLDLSNNQIKTINLVDLPASVKIWLHGNTLLGVDDLHGLTEATPGLYEYKLFNKKCDIPINQEGKINTNPIMIYTSCDGHKA